MFDYRPTIAGFIIGIVLMIALWLIFRKPILWYYRINEIIDLQKRTVEALERMSPVPKNIFGAAFDKPEPWAGVGWTCPKCGTKNGKDDDYCTHCHYSRTGD